MGTDPWSVSPVEAFANALIDAGWPQGATLQAANEFRAGTPLTPLHPAGSGTGREPVAWLVTYPDPDEIVVTTSYQSALEYADGDLSCVRGLFTADALPGQGDGLRETLARHRDWLMREFPGAIVKTLKGNGIDLLEFYDLSIVPALSRSQASAPPTDGAPSEEEIVASCKAFYQGDWALIEEAGSEQHRIWMRRALAAAYAVRDRK